MYAAICTYFREELETSENVLEQIQSGTTQLSCRFVIIVAVDQQLW